MYLETKKTGKFLVKKSLGKKISVKIENGINEKLILKLSEKEILNILNLEEYINFEKIIYNKETLKEVILLSKYYFNINENKKLNQNNFFVNKGFIEKFVYESNRAEGSKISEAEVIKILENKKSNHRNKNEIKEVENSKKLFDFMNEKFIFNELNIKKIYHILTKNLFGETGDKYPRGFKKYENTVNNEITTKPENVAKEINNLINFYKQNKKNIFPLKLAFDFHLKFQKIHPFIDGNGRIGRFLLNKILMTNGYHPMIIFSENRQGFFNSIKNLGVNNKKYYKFMLEQYKKSLDYFKNRK